MELEAAGRNGRSWKNEIGEATAVAQIGHKRRRRIKVEEYGEESYDDFDEEEVNELTD
jgi:hypothetical protein